ncbi:MAG: hypothetical protein QM736_09645 [Vicinamibacterales bacterium]
MRQSAAVHARRVCGAGLAAMCVAASVVVQGQQPQSAADSSARSSVVRTAADTLDERLQRQRAALGRALFAADEPLPVTLIADFKAVNRDRNPREHEGLPGDARRGEPRRQRGSHRGEHPNARAFASSLHHVHVRADSHRVPERREGDGLRRAQVAEARHALPRRRLLRAVPYREYVVYRIFNRVTQRSFRARLASATYVDAENSKPITTRAGLFLEDDDDVARRLGGETSELQGLTFGHVDLESMTLVGLFEYMIGNTDMSLRSCTT